MRGGFPKIFVLAFLSLVLASNVEPRPAKGVKNESLSGKKANIEKIKRELSEKERLVQKLKSKEVSIISFIEDLGNKIRKDGGQLKILNTQRMALMPDIAVIESDILALQKKIKIKEIELKERLITSYRIGKFGFLKILLASESFSDFSAKRYYLEKLIESENRMLANYSQDEENLKIKLLTLHQKRGELDDLTNEVNDRIKGIRKAKGEKSSILKVVRGEKELELKRIKELGEAAGSLQKMINEIPRSGSRETGKFNLNMGRLASPVKGSIAVNFGEYHDSNLNVRMFSKGLSIEAETDTAVKAVFGGRVIYAGSFRGYGNMIIIDHGESYYSLYSKLASVDKKVGDKIEKGDTIGKVGESDLERKPQVYFELRHNGIAIDPLPWFANW